MTRVEWDDELELLVLGRGRARVEIGPNGIAGAFRVERNRVRRIVIELRGFGRDLHTVVLAQVRKANGVEERRLADLPPIAQTELETLLQRLAGLDLRPVVRREHGPSRDGAREVLLSADEIRFLDGASLPPGCFFVPATETNLGPRVGGLLALLGIGVVVGTTAASGGSASIPAALGMAATFVGLALVGGVELSIFGKRPTDGREEGLYLLEDYLLVWADGKTARIPRESFLGAQIREPLGGLGAVYLRYRKGEQTAEIDLSQFGPGRFTPSRWAELVEQCAVWRGRPPRL